MRGTLVLVVGPSGAGKDSVIAGAANRLCDDPRITFARRVITRRAEAGGESHLAVSSAEFAALRERGRLMLHWQAHGFEYGLPYLLAEALEYGHSVVANVSRTVVAAARRDFPPVRVIAVTASPATLGRRLTGRGRETLAEIDRRLQRVGAISPDDADFVINNDGPLELAIDRFIALLREVADQSVASG